jgi:RNA polymerase sigma-70 factor (ECF subfamily)
MEPALEGGSADILAEQSALVSRVLAGDRRAARKLYDDYAPRIYRLAYRLAGDAHLAQDFTQDTFLRAFKALAEFRGEASLFTWLHRIAVSVTLNGLRKVRQFREREVAVNDTETMEGLMPDTVRGSIPAADPGLSRRVAQATEALPEALRMTLIMHDIEGYTHGEIAAALNVPEGTSKARLSTARARLRQALAELQETRA